MGEAAVPAPHRKVPASNRKIMRSGNMTMPALCCLDKLPEIIAPDLRVRSRFCHILNPRYKDPGSPAVIARNLSLVRNRLDTLVCNLFAVITVRAVFCDDELVTHERYWMRPGSLICCKCNRVLDFFKPLLQTAAHENVPSRDRIRQEKGNSLCCNKTGLIFFRKFEYKAITM
jgi:hypothetical protein